jgi:predicted MFS family arabinose efflux permease
MKLNPGLIALSIGAFGIGVTEFAPMGLLPVIATGLGVSIRPPASSSAPMRWALAWARRS